MGEIAPCLIKKNMFDFLLDICSLSCHHHIVFWIWLPLSVLGIGPQILSDELQRRLEIPLPNVCLHPLRFQRAGASKTLPKSIVRFPFDHLVSRLFDSRWLQQIEPGPNTCFICKFKWVSLRSVGSATALKELVMLRGAIAI